MTAVHILTLACERTPYLQLRQAQLDTWEKLTWPGVTTSVFTTPAHDPDFAITRHFKVALKPALLLSWTHLLRPNSSFYVCQRRAWEFSQTLPCADCYAGVPIHAGASHIYASGAGFWL